MRSSAYNLPSDSLVDAVGIEELSEPCIKRRQHLVLADTNGGAVGAVACRRPESDVTE